MKRNGNIAANKTYNPQNAKPSIPLDVDEVDSVLEKFIKQKYDQQLFSGGQPRPAALRHDTGNTGSTRSSEDQPPPLPPKPGKRFGFNLRSASSTTQQRNGLASPPRSPQSRDGWEGPPSPFKINKQSRVFGTSVGGGGESDIEAKLSHLKDMGFADERRNLNVLKGHGGNLEKSVESLVRLGEGGEHAPPTQTPASTIPSVASRQSSTSVAPSIGVGNGISIVKSTEPSQTSTTNHTGDQASGAQRTRSFAPSNPYQGQQTQLQSHNPFDIPARAQQAPNGSAPLDQAFQNMQISQRPLFPNSTGGFPSQPHVTQDPRLQTMTPPIPQLPQQYSQNTIAQTNNVTNGFNPFFNIGSQQPSNNPYQSHPQSPTLQTSFNPYQQQQPPPFANGYGTASPQTYSPQIYQGGFQQEQPLQGFSLQSRQGSFALSSTSQGYSPRMPADGFQNPQMLQTSRQGSVAQPSTTPTYSPQVPQGTFQQPQMPSTYSPQLYQGEFPQQSAFAQQQPFSTSRHPSIDPSQNLPQSQSLHHQQNLNPYNSQPQPQPLQPQATGRVDKTSILALYNYPQLAPQPSATFTDSSAAQQNGSQQPAQATQSQQDPSPMKQSQRSVTMPVALSTGSKNPFQSSVPSSQPVGGGGLAAAAGIGSGPSRHMSQESVDVGGVQNGRHSPDAFASLSSRFVH